MNFEWRLKVFSYLLPFFKLLIQLNLVWVVRTIFLNVQSDVFINCLSSTWMSNMWCQTFRICSQNQHVLHGRVSLFLHVNTAQQVLWLADRWPVTMNGRRAVLKTSERPPSCRCFPRSRCLTCVGSHRLWTCRVKHLQLSTNHSAAKQVKTRWQINNLEPEILKKKKVN